MAFWRVAPPGDDEHAIARDAGRWRERMTAPHDDGMLPSRDDPVTTPPPRRSRPAGTIGSVIGTVMIILGAFVLVRLLLRGGAPLTGTPLLDVAFGLFFIARGALYFWSVRRRMRG